MNNKIPQIIIWIQVQYKDWYLTWPQITVSNVCNTYNDLIGLY